MFVYVEAFCVPIVFKPLVKQNAKRAQETYTHLANLELTDCSDGKKELKIDVLIGQNFHYLFISDTVIQGKKWPSCAQVDPGVESWRRRHKSKWNQSNCTFTHTLSVSSVNDNAYDLEDDIREEL